MQYQVLRAKAAEKEKFRLSDQEHLFRAQVSRNLELPMDVLQHIS